MQKIKDTFRCVLKIASPVHIGCDEVYEPTGFVVDEEKQCLIAFDPFMFIQSLPENERETLSAICRKGTIASVLEIYKFFRGKDVKGHGTDLCRGFVDHYRKVLALPSNDKVVAQNLNKFQISRTAFKSSDNRAYIPGSAIKGALRTAYLNACAKSKKMSKFKGKAADLQAELMVYKTNQIETDPFRLVKVSDFMPVGEVHTKIIYAINKKKKISDREARGPYQILEVVEPGACFIGEISVDAPLSKKFISKPVSLEALLESLNPFYKKENEKECQGFKVIGVEGAALNPAQGEYTLRIGRHSGAESITVDGHRNIKIMRGKKESPKFLDHATTFWLASETEKNQHNKGLRPFGWTVLELLTNEQEKRLRADEEVFVYEQMLIEKKQLDDALEKRELEQKAKEAAERKQREKEETEKREAKRKAAFEAMSPEERDVVALESPDLIENTAVEILNRIDDFSDENKLRAAKALKSFYEANNKWKVNKKKKKQLEKVNKIKAILG